MSLAMPPAPSLLSATLDAAVSASVHLRLYDVVAGAISPITGFVTTVV